MHDSKPAEPEDPRPGGDSEADSASPAKKKAAAEMLVLSMLEARSRHGYEIAKQIERLSGGVLDFRVASLYPLLSRLEERGWIAGRWVEKPGARRRRFDRLTESGHRALGEKRRSWQSFVDAVARVARPLEA